MGKISVGAMVLATLFTLGLCKGGWASETDPSQQEETIAGRTIGEGQTQMIGIGEQTPVSHPDKTQEQQAVGTGNAGSPQYPTPPMTTTVQH